MRAILALGGNLTTNVGDPFETIKAAIKNLSRELEDNISVSSAYVTPAFPAGSGPDFVNAALAVDFADGPDALMAICHEVERSFHRERRVRWEARTVDIDLLAFGDMVLPDRETVTRWMGLDLDAQKKSAPQQLIVPHPRLHERGFVLVPMADIAADWRHPLLNLRVSDMLERLPKAEKAGIQRISTPLWP